MLGLESQKPFGIVIKNQCLCTVTKRIFILGGGQSATYNYDDGSIYSNNLVINILEYNPTNGSLTERSEKLPFSGYADFSATINPATNSIYMIGGVASSGAQKLNL